MNRAYRRHSVRVVSAALWLVPTVFFAVLALDLSPDGASIPTGHRAVYGALALLSAILAIRSWRIGIYTSPSEVVVRNALHSTRLGWQEVAAFEWGEWRGPGHYPCGVVRRSDRRRVTAFALNPPFEVTPGQDRRVPELRAALNEELARARGWSSPPPSGAPGD